MAENSIELPEECWELIFNSLDHYRHFESLSLVSTRFLSISNRLRKTLTITRETLPFLPNLIRRYPNLKSIEIPSKLFRSKLDNVLTELSESQLQLESFHFVDQLQFPYLGLLQFGLKTKSLKELNCSRVGGLQDRDLLLIGSLFPLLEVVDISFPDYYSYMERDGNMNFRHCSKVVTDEGVMELATNLSKLRKINLSGNHFVSDKSLEFLSLNCPLLTEVKVLDCDLITASGVSFMFHNCINLNCIGLDSIGIRSIDCSLGSSFSYAKSLCEVHILNSFISDELLCSIAEASLPLRKSSVSHCYNFSIAGISSLLYRYNFLVYLDLEGASFLTDECLLEMSEFLPNLSFMNLSSCSKLTNLTFFTLLKNCTKLEDVKMERTNLGVEEFPVELVTNSCIKSLNLASNHNMNDECLIKIASCCPSLQILEVSHCSYIKEEGIKQVLRSCSEIKRLEMKRCMGIGNLDLDFELPKLEVLRMPGPIDDESLIVIAKWCKMLLHLDLEGCLDVTAKGVNEVVQNCTRLREINLFWCENVKVDAIASMVFSRPSLRKIVAPDYGMFSDDQISFFLQHGCLVE